MHTDLLPHHHGEEEHHNIDQIRLLHIMIEKVMAISCPET